MQSKMYVLIRQDLKDTAYKGVQGGHALAQYMLDYPNNNWKNHTLVYLTVKDEETLNRWITKLNIRDILHSTFHEPDINNELTAIACLTDKQIFKGLHLLN